MPSQVPDGSSGNESSRVAKLDKVIQNEGLRSAKVLEQLISYLHSPEPGVAGAAAHAIRRALPKLKLASSQASNPVVTKWIESQERLYVQAISEAAVANPKIDGEESEDLRALLVCAAVAGEDGWKSLVQRAIESRQVPILKSLLSRYADLRIAALHAVLNVSNRTSATGRKSAENLSGCLEVLLLCSNGEPELESILNVRVRPAGSKRRRPRALGDHSDDEGLEQSDSRDLVGNAKMLRRVYGDAWVRLLSETSLNSAQRRICLTRIPCDVIPRMSNPLRLSDFLTDTYNNFQDVSMAVAALDGLFVLISKHKLDYPMFYPKLYAILTPEALFYATDRKRFLDLVGIFLTRGAYLPRGLVAAFVKRLVRRALIAPPTGAIWCLRLALDLICKHPAVSFLVHGSVNFFDTVTKESSHDSSGCDPYDDSQVDPQKSGADRSSLWELGALRNHLSPAVSRLADAFTRDPRKAPPLPGDLADHGSWSFEDLFASEFMRRSKGAHMAYDAPDSPRAMEVIARLSPVLKWTT